MIRHALLLLFLLPSLFLNAQERVDLKDLDAYIANAVR